MMLTPTIAGLIALAVMLVMYIAVRAIGAAVNRAMFGADVPKGDKGNG